MHRKITSDDVEGYASHIPKDEVKLAKNEDLVFKRGLLTQASGTSSVKLMPKVRFMRGFTLEHEWCKRCLVIFDLVQQENKTPEDDIEEDDMEAEGRRKRESMTAPNDVDEIKTYDPNLKTNHFESQGSYTLELVGRQRLLRTKRAADYVDLSEAAESSLLAFINHSKFTNTFSKPIWQGRRRV